VERLQGERFEDEQIEGATQLARSRISRSHIGSDMSLLPDASANKLAPWGNVDIRPLPRSATVAPEG
jgi:hypothetical protein